MTNLELLGEIQKKGPRMMTETVDKTQLEQIHKEFIDRKRKCQKCGQRCNQYLFRIVNSLKLCPDCVEGKDCPTFTVKDTVLNLCVKITGWEREQAKLFLTHLPFGLALVAYENTRRTYWNPDRNSPIFRIYSNHNGKIYRIEYYRSALKKLKSK